MTEYFSAHTSSEEAKAAAKAVARKKNRKYVVLGAIAAVAVIPSAAYAFIVGITGSGNIDSEAGETAQLVISQGATAPKLFPGGKVNVSFKVANPNPFPVVLKKVDATGFVVKNDCNPAWFTTTLPVTGASYTFPGFSTADLTIPAKTGAGNGEKTITIPDAVSLSDAATKSCGFNVAITITGDQKAA